MARDAGSIGWVGVPVEGIGLVLGVDRFLDTCRTTLSVSGDARGEPGASTEAR